MDKVKLLLTSPPASADVGGPARCAALLYTVCLHRTTEHGGDSPSPPAGASTQGSTSGLAPKVFSLKILRVDLTLFCL